eukprot:11209265-Lingulodinium_polyedra.AAC.1
MVAVYKAGPGAKNLPFVRGLTAKCAEETETALNSIVAELNSLMGEQLVARFHTNSGSEFLNVMKDVLIKK